MQAMYVFIESQLSVSYKHCDIVYIHSVLNCTTQEYETATTDMPGTVIQIGM